MRRRWPGVAALIVTPMPSRSRFVLVLALSILLMVLLGLGIRHQADADQANAASFECAHSTYHLGETKLVWAFAQHAMVVKEDRPGHRYHMLTNATPSWSDLRPYGVPALWPSNAPAPRCPGGGTWTIGPLSEWPTCSIPSHAAAFRREMEKVEEEKIKEMARGVTNR